MGFFTAPYEIADHEAGGGFQRCCLTDGALQDGIWEELLTEARNLSSGAPSELDTVAWQVKERYARAFADAGGDRVGVLLSWSECADPTALRLYSRVVRGDGEPVVCGFATIVCVCRDSGVARPIPGALSDFLGSRNDGVVAPADESFAEHALSESAVESLFPEAIRALGARVAAPPAGSDLLPPPRRAALRRTMAVRAGEVLDQGSNGAAPGRASRPSSAFALPIPGFASLGAPVGAVAFSFPGERSYEGRLLRELHGYLPYLSDHFHQADDVARRYFRQEFLPLVEVTTLALHDQRLERCPELGHLGVVLCGVLIAETLQEHGIRPDVLIGEGLGELTALAVAGAIDLGAALRLTAQRAMGLRRSPNGEPAEGHDTTFAAALADVTFATPRLQIFLASEPGLLSRDTSPARALSTWLTRSKSFDDAAAAARAAGCERFIECGPGGVLDVAYEDDAAAEIVPSRLIPSLPSTKERHDLHA